MFLRRIYKACGGFLGISRIIGVVIGVDGCLRVYVAGARMCVGCE